MILTRRYTKPIDAFTLIEMMTVVAIMAVLTTVAFPGIKMAMVNAQMARSTQDARSIVMGLRSWATDNGGAFPAEETYEGDSISSSNDAFRDLVPDYIDTEAIFVVGRSNHGKSADNRIDEIDDILQPGENHFAYVAGLTDTSRSNWPLVVDGTDGSGKYVVEPGEKGGCWEGRKAIIAYVGGSAAAVRLRGDRGGPKFIPREGYPEENALDLEYMGDSVELLDPDSD
ncbi:prepilin-type N-terminal cleavage/methylation domain-containing protein [Verrucomicrobiales bacterium]|nr:prepilin-type N-terminal cleavage/methylation domain-containing protein [Verrucomicrobiales bacterium]